MKLENNVFERSIGNDNISANMYNAIIGGVLLWGFAINALLVKMIDTTSLQQIHPLAFLVPYFILCFCGIHIVYNNSSPIKSFIGYNLIVVPFGFVLNLVVNQYDSTVVFLAVVVTGLVTLTMMMLGSLFPKVFMSMGLGLSIALITVIIIECILLFIFKIHLGIIDWVVALIFCGYIGFDWVRANAIPKTVDNAIDSATAIYIDIINLFVRILAIIGKKD